MSDRELWAAAFAASLNRGNSNENSAAQADEALRIYQERFGLVAFSQQEIDIMTNNGLVVEGNKIKLKGVKYCERCGSAEKDGFCPLCSRHVVRTAGEDGPHYFWSPDGSGGVTWRNLAELEKVKELDWIIKMAQEAMQNKVRE